MNLSTKTKDRQPVKNLTEDSVPSFIRKTYEILEEGACSDIIRWSDDGSSIIIVNPTEFAQKILPLYFKHNNLTSFIRQLNMYDFHKKRGLNMDNVYCHDLFQRGKKHMLREIRRKNSNEITMPSVMEKTIPVLEATQARQDLAAVVHENVILKNYNRDAINRATLIETKFKEISIENQALWNQIYQLKEKENLLKNVIVNLVQQNGLSLSSIPPFLQSELEFASINPKGPQELKDNSPPFAAQTTTKMFFPTHAPFSQAFVPFPQDIQKGLRLNPTQLSQPNGSDFSNPAVNPSMDLGNIKYQKDPMQAGLNDPKHPLLNYDANRAPQQQLNPKGTKLENLKLGEPANPIPNPSLNLSLNNTGFTEGIASQYNGKRNQLDTEEKGSVSKKLKQDAFETNGANSRPNLSKENEITGIQTNPTIATHGGYPPINIKDECLKESK